MNAEQSRGIEIQECDYPTTCDGCNSEIPKGARYLVGIESCCGGGCCRCLCLDCVAWAAKEAQP